MNNYTNDHAGKTVSQPQSLAPHYITGIGRAETEIGSRPPTAVCSCGAVFRHTSGWLTTFGPVKRLVRAHIRAERRAAEQALQRQRAAQP